MHCFSRESLQHRQKKFLLTGRATTAAAAGFGIAAAVAEALVKSLSTRRCPALAGSATGTTALPPKEAFSLCPNVVCEKKERGS
jgi:hypothetical protein